MALAGGFVEEDGGCGGGVEGFDVALHWDLDAGVGGMDDVFGEAGPFIADEQGDGLAPIDFPGGGGSVCAGGIVGAGGDGGNGVEFELREENAEGGSGDDWEMERCPCRGAKGFWREGAGGAALAGGGGDGSGGAECGGGAENGAHVAGILDSGKNYDEWRAGATGRREKIFELRGAGNDEGGDTLGMLGVGDAVEEAIGGGENRNGNFGAGDERRELGAMTFAGFGEEDSFDAAAGGEGFFDEAETFDADTAGFGGETAAEGDAKELEPAIVAAGEEGG